MQWSDYYLQGIFERDPGGYRTLEGNEENEQFEDLGGRDFEDWFYEEDSWGKFECRIWEQGEIAGVIRLDFWDYDPERG